MPRTTRTATHQRGHIAVSIMLAGALLMPTFPLSEVVPAHADAAPSDTAAAVGTDAAAASNTATARLDRICEDVPLSGATVDAQGTVALAPADPSGTPLTLEEKQAALDGHLADGTIARADLDDERVVDALTGDYLDDESWGGVLLCPFGR